MTRRKLQFEKLDQVIVECEQLMNSGYSQNGNWSLGQICRHLKITIEANMDGYPWWMSIGYPLRPILRRFLLPRLLQGDSPAGIRTASNFVPPDQLVDRDEANALFECITRFCNFQNQLHPHPGFGRLSHQDFERFHAAHAAHHLGFLSPGSN